MVDFEHGATDSGPDPLADFSTCAHPFGPCPWVLRAVLLSNRTRYPDPSYLALRDRLGAFHETGAERIVPGAGASELIHRMVRCVAGGVLAWTPSFVEYRRAALVCRREFLAPSDPDEWLESVPREGIAFLCQPNNPDGRCHSTEFLVRAVERCRSRGCRLVLDLAYADFCPGLPVVPEGCDLLFAPNKKFGLTGIRAGFVACADAPFARTLNGFSPSWVLGAEGVAFLLAGIEFEAIDWFRNTLYPVLEATSQLRELLVGNGWRCKESQAHYLAAHPGFGVADSPDADSARWTAELRRRGVRVRDLTNTGMPGWLRLAARPSQELDTLRSALASIGGPRQGTLFP